MTSICSALILLMLACAPCIAGEPHPIVRDILAMEPCSGYLKRSEWGTNLDDAVNVLRVSGSIDTVSIQPGGAIAVIERPSKNLPVDSATSVITVMFDARMLVIGCTLRFATEHEATDAVTTWNERAAQTWGRQKGRESEYLAASCADGTKLMAMRMTMTTKTTAMFTIMFLGKQ